MTTARSPYSKPRLQEKLTQEISLFLRKNISDPRLTMVSITHTELSKDLSIAKVYWDTFDETHREEMGEAILKTAGKIRKLLGKVLTIRHIPEIQFVYNSQYESEREIEKLLNT